MSKYKIFITKRAQKDIKKLDPDAKRQIIQAIDSLANNPNPPNVKALKGDYKGFLRKRSGDYRIIYEKLESDLKIIVVRAGHRKDIYD